jgi:hypothetical protein
MNVWAFVSLRGRFEIFEERAFSAASSVRQRQRHFLVSYFRVNLHAIQASAEDGFGQVAQVRGHLCRRRALLLGGAMSGQQLKLGSAEFADREVRSNAGALLDR